MRSRSTSAVRFSRPRLGRVRESLTSVFSLGSLASAEAVPNCGRQSGLSGEDSQPGRPSQAAIAKLGLAIKVTVGF